MNLNLLSLNVRGLNAPASISQTQHNIRSQQPLDIVLLQEHKLRGTSARHLEKRLWPKAAAWCIDATDGYNNATGDAGAGRGGVASFVAPRLAANVGQSGTIMDNRVHWFILKGIAGGDIGIANVYAHNNVSDRCLLWERMILELPLVCRWIMAGDFNMVEARQDKTNPCGRLIAARERLMFNNLKTQLNVEDNPRFPGSLRYSWDNQRMDGTRIFARLDRIYMFQSIPGEAHRHILDYSARVVSLVRPSPRCCSAQTN